MTKTMWQGLAAAIIVAATAAACGGGGSSTSSTPTSPTTTTTPPATTTTPPATTTTPPATTTTPPTTATITIGADGSVTPKSVTIARGGRVTMVNNHTQAHDMESDPHPEHTDCPDLNWGFLSPGQQKASNNLNTVRTCGFHDHDRADVAALKGTVIIQ